MKKENRNKQPAAQNNRREFSRCVIEFLCSDGSDEVVSLWGEIKKLVHKLWTREK